MFHAFVLPPGVIIAARSLIALFREINPELLPKRERGKTASMELAAGEKKKPVYGATAVAKGVDGTQFLVGKVLEEVDDGAWEIDENGDSDDAEEGWVTIPSGDTRTHIELSETDSSSDNDEDEEEEAADEDEESDGDEAEESDDEEVVESDDDAPELADAPVDESAGAAPVLPIEATRLLTPADFALMKKLRQEAEAERMVNGPFGAHKRDRPPMTADDAEADNDEGIIDTALILGPRKKKKQDKEERLASIAEGRKDRAKFGSSRGKERGSMTNKEKSKKKNFMMMVHKRSVAGKKKMSLRDKQLKLRKHVDRQKKQKH